MNSDSEVEEETPWKGVSATVILMNAFDPLQLGTLPASYNATCELVRKGMRRTNNQQLGICLYGTKESNLGSGVEGVYQIFPLCEPSLDEFKKLQDTHINFCGQAQELKLSDVLWHCGKMFSNCKKLLSTKTVVILTRMDIPPAPADQDPALKRVEDLVVSGITLKIINVSENEYHVDKFYDDLMKEAHKGNEYKMPMPVWQQSDIVKLMYRHTHRHIAIARLDLKIAEDFSIGVGVYSLLQSQTKPKRYYADKETCQIVTRVTTNYKSSDKTIDINDEDMDVDVPEKKEVPLLKTETLYYQTVGEEKIEFSDDEMKIYRNPFGPPQMKLLGFKPASTMCKEKWFLKGCYFLFPNESMIEGSTVAFKALHQACVEMSVIALCVLCTRVNSRPFIVALSPCSKPLGLDVQIGFDVITIPFVENVREIPTNEESDINVEEPHKIVLKSILEDLTFNYTPDTFENPSLNSLLSSLEALALEKEDIEDFHDTTKADPSKFRKIDAELFEELFGPFGATAKKRVASASYGAGGKKDRVEYIDEELLETRLNQHQVEKYTVPELKQILKEKRVQTALTGLKKNELVDLVYRNCRKEN